MLTIVGSGPARTAVEAALEDVGADRSADIDSVAGAQLAVVVDTAGAERLERVDDLARAGGTPWLAVELGGLGGRPVVDAAITGLGPEGPCYRCLRTRVRALDESPGSDPTDVDPTTARLAGAVAGHEAARYVDGDAAVPGRVIEVPYTERPLLPVPGCVCATARDTTVSRTHTERDVAAALERAETALDERVGVVREVGEAESFPVPYYLAQVCDTSGFSDATAPRNAAGVDLDWDGAFMKALGEGLERYCAGVYREADFETGPPDSVPDAVDPSAFVCEHEPAGESIRWVRGTNLAGGAPVALPAAFVHHPPPERRYRPPVTTGLGLGNGGVGALLSGLYEVIERDAAMLAWYSSFEPLELHIEDDTVETLRSRARSEGLAVTLLVLTVDIDVPVVAAAVHREAWPRFALGTAAALDVAAAARSALSEALQNWTELRGMGPERAAQASGEIGAYADLPDRARAFVDAEVTVTAADIAGDTPAGKAALDAVLDRLDAAGLSAYAARTTTRDVEQLGFEAVRVLVPGAQPLTFGDPYFGERAETVPGSLGFAPRLDRPHHPFP